MLTNLETGRHPPRPSPVVAVRTYAIIIPFFGRIVKLARETLPAVWVLILVDAVAKMRYN